MKFNKVNLVHFELILFLDAPTSAPSFASLHTTLVKIQTGVCAYKNKKNVK